MLVSILRADAGDVDSCVQDVLSLYPLVHSSQPLFIVRLTSVCHTLGCNVTRRLSLLVERHLAERGGNLRSSFLGAMVRAT